MTNLISSAAKLNYKLILLSELNYNIIQIPIKVRLIGRVIGLNDKNNTILILDEERGLIIDISACISGTTYMPKLKDLIMISGELCNNISKVPTPPTEVPHAIAFVVNHQILQATLIKSVEELDLGGWREAVKLQGKNT